MTRGSKLRFLIHIGTVMHTYGNLIKKIAIAVQGLVVMVKIGTILLVDNTMTRIIQ